MRHRISELDRRARELQYPLPTPHSPEQRQHVQALKPPGILSLKTEAVLTAAAAKFNLKTDELRIIMDKFSPLEFGADFYEAAAQSVSNMMHGDNMTFEQAMEQMNQLLQIEGT